MKHQEPQTEANIIFPKSQGPLWHTSKNLPLKRL